ncbi:MAG: hypothetical protein JWN37_558 [Candidatus Nomurabacteria bacterium]|nr:hypothetical protein [Candidatus Nomurabacteria bacterium]
MNKIQRNTLIGLLILIIIGIIAYYYSVSSKTVEQVTATTTVVSDIPNFPPTDSVTGKPVTSSEERFITQSNNNTIVRIKKGERFLLKLGEMNWNISLSNPNIVERVKNIAVMKDAQGIYEGKTLGTTDILGEGRPICNQGEMCAQFIINFKVTIIVE